MTLMHAADPRSTVPPIMDCPTCYPGRPMVIKTVATSLRGKAEKIVFECPVCGATRQVPASVAAPGARPEAE